MILPKPKSIGFPNQIENLTFCDYRSFIRNHRFNQAEEIQKQWFCEKKEPLGLKQRKFQ